MVNIKKVLNDIDNKTIIYILFAAVFLPLNFNILTIAVVLIYILLTNRISGCFQKNSSSWVITFVIYTIVIAALNSNFFGIARALAFFSIIIIAKFVRKNITLKVFETGLDITCIMAAFTAIICVFDFIYNQFILSYKGVYRCKLYFYNSNFLATLFAIVIIICGYKLLNHNRKPIYYCIIALFSAVGAYLTGSMFVWVEVFIGCSSLLLLTRKHQLLSALFLLAGTFIVVLYFLPGILPRINQSNVTTDNRILVWKTTLLAIKDATPFFGKGFLSYMHIKDNYPGSYGTIHSHSIFLEPILCFGIIGTIMIVVYFKHFYQRVSLCRNAQHKHCISSLIIAISLAALVHGTTDLTFQWIQTGFFYSLIFASIGVEEKLLKIN